MHLILVDGFNEASSSPSVDDNHHHHHQHHYHQASLAVTKDDVTLALTAGPSTSSLSSLSSASFSSSSCVNYNKNNSGEEKQQGMYDTVIVSNSINTTLRGHDDDDNDDEDQSSKIKCEQQQHQPTFPVVVQTHDPHDNKHLDQPQQHREDESKAGTTTTITTTPTTSKGTPDSSDDECQTTIIIITKSSSETNPSGSSVRSDQDDQFVDESSPRSTCAMTTSDAAANIYEVVSTTCPRLSPPLVIDSSPDEINESQQQQQQQDYEQRKLPPPVLAASSLFDIGTAFSETDTRTAPTTTAASTTTITIAPSSPPLSTIRVCSSGSLPLEQGPRVEGSDADDDGALERRDATTAMTSAIDVRTSLRRVMMSIELASSSTVLPRSNSYSEIPIGSIIVRPAVPLKTTTTTTTTLGETKTHIHNKKHSKDPLRQVTFHKVYIRYYPMTLGLNPACQYGAPVELDWVYYEDELLPGINIDDYEIRRRKTRRTKLQHLVLSSYRRRDILLALGFEEEQQRVAAKTVETIQWQRSTTRLLLPLSKMEEVAQSAKRKAKRYMGIMGMAKRGGGGGAV
jgi:hypothetical protein